MDGLNLCNVSHYGESDYYIIHIATSAFSAQQKTIYSVYKLSQQ